MVLNHRNFRDQEFSRVQFSGFLWFLYSIRKFLWFDTLLKNSYGLLWVSSPQKIPMVFFPSENSYGFSPLRKFLWFLLPQKIPMVLIPENSYGFLPLRKFLWFPPPSENSYGFSENSYGFDSENSYGFLPLRKIPMVLIPQKIPMLFFKSLQNNRKSI